MPRYGTPEDLKRLVEAAHARGLMVLLDVVYNHFGPEGNYLHVYAPQFFNARQQTPWGAAINFDGAHARTVRDFFIHNALYWIEEYHFDGLRLDAVHAIVDDSQPDIVAEIARAVRDGPARERHVHLVLENDSNEARYLGARRTGRPVLATAQWNDDLHHALHVLAHRRARRLLRRLRRRAALVPRPLPGRGLRATRASPRPFAAARRAASRARSCRRRLSSNFLQTHDQVGNRAFGERIGALAPAAALDAAVACLLLAPAPPMLFMGEEFAASAPFLFFCDFGPELAAAVTRGRREEFGALRALSRPGGACAIPDPNDAATVRGARSSTGARRAQPAPASGWRCTAGCSRCAARTSCRAWRGMRPSGTFECCPRDLLAVAGRLPTSHAAPGRESRPGAGAPVAAPPGRAVYASDPAPAGRARRRELAPVGGRLDARERHGEPGELERLAALHGIALDYDDIWGRATVPRRRRSPRCWRRWACTCGRRGGADRE